MSSFFDIVKNKPEKCGKKCPYCNSKKIEKLESSTTLVGGGPGVNHEIDFCECRNCNKRFNIESRYFNTWITSEDRKILKGVPSCFENYIYTCKYCDGDVHRIYTEMDGKTPANSLSRNNGIRQYRIFFECQSCKEKVESETEYYKS